MMLERSHLSSLIAEVLAESRSQPRQTVPSVACTLYGADGELIPLGRASRDEGGMVAVVHLSGVTTRHGYSTWTSSSVGTLEIGRALQRLDRDKSVAAIVLAIDSPGGTVTGTAELSDVVFGIRESGNTKIVAIADSMMASAACYIGSAASEVYATPSATVGSIGVITSYSDFSRYLEKQGVTQTIVRTPDLKARFSGSEPLSVAMRETMQASVEDAYATFTQAMARNRGVSVAHVTKRFGGGETMTSQQAVEAGLIDGIASSPDEIIGSLLRDASTRRR